MKRKIIEKLNIEITDEILKLLDDYGLKIIDTQMGYKEQFDIFNIQGISEEYFNEKINEAIENNNDKINEVVEKL